MSLGKIEQAQLFCEKAHSGQVRKYTGEPYAVHPKAVALIVAEVTADADMICAALLHDVVEDTPVTFTEIFEKFGGRVMQLVSEVTNISKKSDGSRKERKQIDRNFLAKASGDAQTIKLADIMDNIVSIVSHDPKFAKLYLNEKAQLLYVLTKGNMQLQTKAKDLVAEGQYQLEQLEPEGRQHDLFE